MSRTLEIQAQLKKLGFDPGPLDGQDGPKTRAAVRAFQAARGLSVDGIVGDRTRAALFGALVEESDKGRVYIDIGHGAVPGGFDPGAVHGPSSTSEHSLNVLCAGAMRDALLKRGLDVVVADQSDSLYSLGRAARGFDVFVSVHHNAVAVGTKAQYATARFHSKKGSNADKVAGMAVTTAIAKALGIPDKGALPMALGVLSGAKDAGVPVAFLIEPYFIHHQTPDNPPAGAMRDWSVRAGTAAGEALADWMAAQ